MLKILFILTLFWAIQVAIQAVIKEENVQCDKDKEYYINKNHGNLAFCQECPTCDPGYGLIPPCGSSLEKKQDLELVRCKPCISGSNFSDTFGPEACRPCKRCEQNKVVYRKCTPKKNTICRYYICEKSYYFDQLAKDCQPCSQCCDNVNDLVKPECVAHGMPKTHTCSVDRAVECPLRIPKSFSKITKLPEGPEEKTSANTETLVILGTIAGAIVIMLILLSLIIYIIVRLRKTVTTSHHQEHDIEMEGLGESSTECETCIRLRDEARINLMISNKQFCEGMNFVISCKCHINITNGDEIVYIWKKDGVELKRHQEELTIDSLKVSDFGRYECVVKCREHQESQEAQVMSEVYFLEVKPGKPNRRYTRLNELKEIKIKQNNVLRNVGYDDERCILVHIAKDWEIVRKVAVHYELSPHQIDVLQLTYKSRHYDSGTLQSAEDTLEAIHSSKPQLTIYDFCKFLKSIGQTDIVEVLENHLITSSEPRPDEEGEFSAG